MPAPLLQIIQHPVHRPRLERHGARNRAGHVDLAGAGEFQELDQFGAGVVGAADDVAFADEEVGEGVEFEFAEVDGHDHQAAAGGEGAEAAVGDGGVAGEVEDDVDALAVRGAEDGFVDRGLAGVEGGGAELGGQFELFGDDVHREDLRGAERSGELDRGDAEASEAEDGDGVAFLDVAEAEGVVGRRRRAHHDGGDVGLHLVGDGDGVDGGDDDPLGVAAVAVFAEHLAGGAELFAVALAAVAFAATG